MDGIRQNLLYLYSYVAPVHTTEDGIFHTVGKMGWKEVEWMLESFMLLKIAKGLGQAWKHSYLSHLHDTFGLINFFMFVMAKSHFL